MDAQKRGEMPLADWAVRGACAGIDDTDLFFPDRNSSAYRALEYCRACPVVRECRTHALELPERFGVWGGLTEVELDDLRRAAGATGVRPPVHRPSRWVGLSRRSASRGPDALGA